MTSMRRASSCSGNEGWWVKVCAEQFPPSSRRGSAPRGGAGFHRFYRWMRPSVARTGRHDASGNLQRLCPRPAREAAEVVPLGRAFFNPTTPPPVGGTLLVGGGEGSLNTHHFLL